MIDVPVLVKDALRDGRLKKNYRILVLNDDGTTDFVIDNDTLVRETVDIDERMCSGDTIKFGLCEGSSLEFQYFIHPSIYGRQLQVFVDVYTEELVENPAQWHDITTLSENNLSFTVQNAGEYKLEWSGIQPFDIRWTTNGTVHEDTIYPVSGDHTLPFGNMIVGDTIELTTVYAGSEYSLDLKGYYSNWSHWYSIPLGFFTVQKCSRQASTGIKKVTAYNKLKSSYLDQKANKEIAEISPDGIDDGKASIGTIIDALLDGYTIEKKMTGIEYSSFSHTSSVSGISCQLLDRSGTFEFWMSSQNASAELHDFNGKIIEIKNIQKYCDFAKSVMNSIQTWIIETIKNGDTFWENTIKPYFLANMFPVVFATSQADEGTQYIYVPKEYITSDVVVWWTYTYHLRPLETLYRLDGPVYRVLPKRSLWFSLWCDAKIYDSNLNVIDSWQYENVGDFVKSLPEFWDVEQDSSIIDNYEVSLTSLPDVTLRELQSAVFELNCQFGQLDRVTDLFSGVELNHSRLYPAADLYPANSLYPDGAAMSSEKSMYSKLWADEGNVQKWRNLIITYKGLDENNQEKDFTLERVVNADGTQDYNMSDNWIFKNLVWTAADVEDYADAMVDKMRSMTWFPFEMWCAGLPYLETGDEIEISIGQTTYTSYILQRQLKGIQNLQDTYINGTLDIF